MSSRVEALFSGIQRGDSRALSQAITLIESTLEQDRVDADGLMDLCAPLSGNSHRIAITGVPGVGKSTFIESLGVKYCEDGHRVAVLAIDPSSTKTGGSILGDKTRMERLSVHQSSFIRPSAAASTLGGVAKKTREAILLCEATGYNIVFVETVGVGQSEIAVHSMVDTFVLMMLAGAGDELQGIKRGIMEMADILLINKVEENNMAEARAAMSNYRSALHLLGDSDTGWSTSVELISSLYGGGMEKAMEMITLHMAHLTEYSRLQSIRAAQNLEWFEQVLRDEVFREFTKDPVSKEKIERFRKMIASGTTSPVVAVRRILGD